MTQLPDLVRPTLWRLHLRLAWDTTTPYEVEGAYLDDALHLAAGFDSVTLDRVARAEFQALDSGEWREVAQQFLQEAIVLVTRMET